MPNDKFFIQKYSDGRKSEDDAKAKTKQEELFCLLNRVVELLRESFQNCKNKSNNQ